MLLNTSVMRTLRRAGGFYLSVGLSSLVGLVSIPLVIAQAGAEIWAFVAVGQAMGAIGSTIISYGWPVTGPSGIASSPAEARGRMIADSLSSRAILLVPVIAVLTVYVRISVGDLGVFWAVLVAALTPAVGGMTASWIFVGEGRPGDLNRLDVIPRTLGTVAGVFFIIGTEDILAFVLCQFAGQLLALGASYGILSRRYKIRGSGSIARNFQIYGEGFAGFASAAVTATYQNLPIALVGALAPSALATIAMADRIYRMAQLALIPISQLAQGYVPAAVNRQEKERRAVVVVRVSLIAGVVAGAAYATGVSWVGGILSHGEIEVGVGIAGCFGLALATAFISSVIGRACLVPLGLVHKLAVSTVCIACVGVGAVAGLGALHGGAGAALGIAITETLGAALLGGVLCFTMRGRKTSETGNGNELL